MGKLTSSIVYSRTKLTLDSVKKINLWGCDIDDISICKEMVNVQILSLSRNKIKSLEPLQHCTNLEELYIRGNEITEFNEFEFLAKCRKLKVLWIDENPCTTNVEYRKIIVGLIPSLTNLDDKAVSEDDHGRSVLMEAMASSFHESNKTATSPSNVEMSQSCYTPRHNYPVIDSILPQMTASYHQKSFQQQTDYGSSCYEINDQPIINNMMTSSYHQNYHNNRVTRPSNMMSASMMEFPKSPEYIPANMSSSDSIAEDDCTPTEEIIEFGNYEYENNAPYEPVGYHNSLSRDLSRQGRSYQIHHPSLNRRNISQRSYSMSPGRKNKIENIINAITSLMSELDSEGLRNVVQIAEAKMKKLR